MNSCGSRITIRSKLQTLSDPRNFHGNSLFLQLLAQFLRCLALLCKKDGLKAVVAQNLLLKQQLIVLNRGRKRAPSISPLHRSVPKIDQLSFRQLFALSDRKPSVF